jgi:hypothetical protein
MPRFIRIMWWPESVMWDLGKAVNGSSWYCINIGHLMVQVRFWK